MRIYKVIFRNVGTRAWRWAMLDGSGKSSAVLSLLERDGNQQQRPHPVGGFLSG